MSKINTKEAKWDAKMQFLAHYGAIIFRPEILKEERILLHWEGMMDASEELDEEEIETTKYIARSLNDLDGIGFFESSVSDKEQIINDLTNDYKKMLGVLKDSKLDGGPIFTYTGGSITEKKPKGFA